MKASGETKAKLSAASKGRAKSEGHKAKIAERNRTRALIPVSDETKEKMSIAKKNYRRTFKSGK
jgi:hypothetical protein